MTVKTTLHSIDRLLERTNIGSKRGIKEISKKAKLYGRSRADYDGDFRKFLDTHYKEKSGSTRFKIYNRMIFVFGGTKSCKLITAVNIPEKYWDSAANPIRDTRCRVN